MLSDTIAPLIYKILLYIWINHYVIVFQLSVITDDTFHRSDILVLTPQILTNALASGKIKSIKLFTMIILDECHHTSKDHPYATMMKCYLQEKQKSSTGLPQVYINSSLWI